MVIAENSAGAGSALNAHVHVVLVFDRGAAGKIRIAAADSRAEVDGDHAAAAGHGNPGHRRRSTGGAASASGAGSRRDSSFRGGIRPMTGSGLASARACSVHCAARAVATYQTRSAPGATETRFVATGG